MLKVTDKIILDESELIYHFVRASGPGGQHVNKASTAVQLRFDVANSPSLPEDVRVRLMTLAANQINKDGELVIDAREHRSQRRNRQEATERLVALVRQATRRPPKRRKTRPSRAAKERRLQNKRHRSRIKSERRLRERY